MQGFVGLDSSLYIVYTRRGCIMNVGSVGPPTNWLQWATPLTRPSPMTPRRSVGNEALLASKLFAHHAGVFRYQDDRVAWLCRYHTLAATHDAVSCHRRPSEYCMCGDLRRPHVFWRRAPCFLLVRLIRWTSPSSMSPETGTPISTDLELDYRALLHALNTHDVTVLKEFSILVKPLRRSNVCLVGACPEVFDTLSILQFFDRI